MKITVTKIEIALDPVVHVWNVEIEDDRGSWRESYGSKEQVDTFLRGLQAGISLISPKHTFPEIEYFDGERLVPEIEFVAQCSEDVSVMTDEERERRIRSYEEWSGMRRQELIERTERHDRPIGSGYAAWLVLLGRGDLLTPSAPPMSRSKDVSMLARDNTVELPDFVRTHLGVEAGQYVYFVKHGDGFRVVSEAAMDCALKVETPRT